LKLVLGNATNLTFPIAIVCTFDPSGSPITTSDLTPTVKEVTQNGAAGDPTALQVAVSIS